MAVTKKLKDLTPQQKKVRRSFKYKEVMKVEIPVKDIEHRKIVKGMWYVIWEKTILKPTILKYAFRGEYFAEKYCEKHLKGYNYNILPGSVLLELGFEKAHRALRSVAGIKNAGAFNYNFPDELDQQRKKTLRTMYRRNLRRLYLKLIKHGKNI